MISSLLNDETEDSNAILAAIPWLVVDEDRGVVGSRTRQDARPPVRKLRALVEHDLLPYSRARTNAHRKSRITRLIVWTISLISGVIEHSKMCCRISADCQKSWHCGDLRSCNTTQVLCEELKVCKAMRPSMKFWNVICCELARACFTKTLQRFLKLQGFGNVKRY